MILHQGETRHPIQVLLDTGCSVPLINRKTVERLKLQKNKRENPRIIESFTGQTVDGAREYYTYPLVLQHRKHFAREIMEVAPMDRKIDIFLPFWWVAKHAPQGAWEDKEIRFNSPRCLEECTRYETADFTLSWDETVCLNKNVGIIGYVSVVSEEDPLSLVPKEFHEYLDVMSKETADALPQHQSYNCRIDLKKGEVAPWGPIYPLSENELETLQEWLKEMLKTGKIRRSTSPAGSPILLVPKPNGRGIRLCVDYRAVN